MIKLYQVAIRPIMSVSGQRVRSWARMRHGLQQYYSTSCAAYGPYPRSHCGSSPTGFQWAMSRTIRGVQKLELPWSF